MHASFRPRGRSGAPVFALKIGEIAPRPLPIDYGYVLVRRCAAGSPAPPER